MRENQIAGQKYVSTGGGVTSADYEAKREEELSGVIAWEEATDAYRSQQNGEAV
jgi:hypothetical protein